MAKDDGKVLMELIANNAQAIRAWQQLQNQIGSLEKQLERLKNGGIKAGSSLEKAFSGFLVKFVSIQAAGRLATAAIDGMVSKVRELNDEGARTVRTFDKLFRQLQVQTGMQGAEFEKMKRQVLELSQKYALPVDVVESGVRQLASSDVPVNQLFGPKGAAEGMARAIVASNAAGKPVDAQQLAESSTQYLNAMGIPLTGENVSKAMRYGANLYSTTNLQLQDLTEFAKAGSTLAGGGIGLEESLAIGSIMRDVFQPEQSAVGMRNIVGRMRTVGSERAKFKRKELDSIGLSPEQIDLEGESFSEAMASLSGALSSVGSAQRAQVLKALFEEEGVAYAEHLMANYTKIPGRITMMKEGAGASFEDRVKIATEGPAAQAQRLETGRQIVMDQPELNKIVSHKQAYEIEQIRRGRSPLGQWVAGGIYGGLTGIGMSPDSAAFWAEGMIPFDYSGRRNEAVRQNVGQTLSATSQGADNTALVAEIQKQTAVMERIESNTKPQPGLTKTSPGGAPAALERNASSEWMTSGGSW